MRGSLPSDQQTEQRVATEYVTMIKEKYAHDYNYTYNQFMRILQDYQNGRKDMPQVVKEVGIDNDSNI